MRNEFFICGDEVFIKLSQGKWTIIDLIDLDKLMELNVFWNAHKSFYTWYGRATLKGKRLRLHRVLLNLKDSDAEIVDHKSRNGLDNKRNNIRITNNNSNMFNTKQLKNNTSGVKGVSFCKERGSWEAHITINNKKINLGRYRKKSDAIEARSKAEDAYVL